MDSADRLRAARERAGFATAADGARRLNVPVATYSGHENGSRGLKREVAARYAKAFGVTPEWLLFGSGTSDFLHEGHPAIETEPSLIVVYDVQASAGPGSFVDDYEAVASRLSFPPDYLRHITTTSPENLAILSVTGNSMTPSLNHGDVVMVDMTKTDASYDGIFVLRVDGLLKVKRVRPARDRESVVLMSDNPRVPDVTVPADAASIVGKVIWVGAKQ